MYREKDYRNSHQKIQEKSMVYPSQHGHYGSGRIVSKELTWWIYKSYRDKNIFLKYGIRYRQSKVTLGDSLDPEYHLKKRESKI